jgi:hypothetical protein
VKLPKTLFIAVEGDAGQEYLAAYKTPEGVDEGENSGECGVYELVRHVAITREVKVLPMVKRGR